MSRHPAGPARVSVVVPMYNAAASIRRTLDSVLAQTYPSFEVIVIDDGSSDDSAACVASHHPDVRLLRQERNAGAAAAANRGVAAAQGELIAFLDSDDLWSPDKLALQVEDFDDHPEAVLSFTDITYGRSGIGTLYSWLYPIDPGRLPEQLMEENPALPSAVMVRKSDFARVGGYAEEVLSLRSRPPGAPGRPGTISVPAPASRPPRGARRFPFAHVKPVGPRLRPRRGAVSRPAGERPLARQ